MPLYTHFTSEQRDELSVLLRVGMEQAEIACILFKGPSSVSREIKRNANQLTGEYHAKIAKRNTRERRRLAKAKTCKILNNSKLRKDINRRLKKCQSPDEIAGRLEYLHGVHAVGKDAIYAYIYKHRPDLEKYLRCRKGKYRRKKGTKKRAKAREDLKKKRIDTRPAIVETRLRVGDLEGDTMIGTDKKSAILTQVDRKSGYLIADKLETRTAAEVKIKMVRRFTKLPKGKKFTMTLDNGTEFSDHELIEKESGVAIYFAYPYHSWERGTNENTNGLLRQFFPKGTSFVTITQKDVDRAVSLINHRPRKRLGYRTPHEVFFNCTSS